MCWLAAIGTLIGLLLWLMSAKAVFLGIRAMLVTYSQGQFSAQQPCRGSGWFLFLCLFSAVCQPFFFLLSVMPAVCFSGPVQAAFSFYPVVSFCLFFVVFVLTVAARRHHRCACPVLCKQPFTQPGRDTTAAAVAQRWVAVNCRGSFSGTPRATSDGKFPPRDAPLHLPPTPISTYPNQNGHTPNLPTTVSRIFYLLTAKRADFNLRANRSRPPLVMAQHCSESKRLNDLFISFSFTVGRMHF
jgi:hypothetical protein